MIDLRILLRRLNVKMWILFILIVLPLLASLFTRDVASAYIFALFMPLFYFYIKEKFAEWKFYFIDFFSNFSLENILTDSGVILIYPLGIIHVRKTIKHQVFLFELKKSVFFELKKILLEESYKYKMKYSGEIQSKYYDVILQFENEEKKLTYIESSIYKRIYEIEYNNIFGKKMLIKEISSDIQRLDGDTKRFSELVKFTITLDITKEINEVKEIAENIDNLVSETPSVKLIS